MNDSADSPDWSSAVQGTSRAAALGRALSRGTGGPSNSLRGAGSYVFDQGAFPGCVACALATGLGLLKSPGIVPSPLFLYYVVAYQLKKVEPNGELILNGALAALAAKGVCSLELHDPPFTWAGAALKPSEPAFDDARQRRLVGSGLLSPGYEIPTRLSRATWVRQHIDSGQQAAFDP